MLGANSTQVHLSKHVAAPGDRSTFFLSLCKMQASYFKHPLTPAAELAVPYHSSQFTLPFAPSTLIYPVGYMSFPLCAEICTLCAEICTLWAEICTLCAEICTLCAEICTLCAEICTLWAEICTLRAEICTLWAAVLNNTAYNSRFLI